MRRLFSNFPSGSAGIALLLLRLAVALLLASEARLLSTGQNQAQVVEIALAGLAGLAGVFVALGLLSPVFQTAAAILQLALLSRPIWIPDKPMVPSTGTLALTGLICGCLILLGPGAYAIDARMFGRREIIIPAHADHQSE